jgi:purine nucleosidase/pyrimidine-specific ribonucleoside hydrolase
MKERIILDTDIGDDIDDAFALSLAYSLKDVEIVGVTTVYKNVVARAQQVLHFFDIVKENNIPVRAGNGTPIKELIKLLPGETDLNELPCQYENSYSKYLVNSESASDFIIRCLKKEPLTLVAVGALTNIAEVIKKDTTVLKNIKKLVIMGGWYAGEHPEWNILCDPEAADIVFKSGIDIYGVGLDVTLKCPLDVSLLDEFRNSQKASNMLLIKWLDLWQKKTKFVKSILHDPLAVSTLNTDICEFEKKKISVDLEKERGKVYEDINGSILNVAVNVNKEKFYDLLKNQLL